MEAAFRPDVPGRKPAQASASDAILPLAVHLPDVIVRTTGRPVVGRAGIWPWGAARLAYVKLKTDEWNAYSAHFIEWDRGNTLDI